MNLNVISHNPNSHRLLLIFAGWSTDSRLFEPLHAHDYSVAVVWDYTDENIPEADILDRFDEICVLAWSFGVPHAARFISLHPELNITRRIAANGTMFPVDDERGIPAAVFEGTVSNLSERSLQKFQMRMCGGKDAYSSFTLRNTNRAVNTLAGELRSIAARDFSTLSQSVWSDVIISERDNIIPSANQHRAWEGHGSVITLPGPHLPDFQKIVDLMLVDKALVAQKFKHSRNSYADNAPVQAHMAQRLARLLSESTSARPHDILEFGAGTGMFTEEYLKLIHPENLRLYDIVPVQENLPGEHFTADAETAILTLPTKSADVIASAATVQWFNNPFKFAAECYRVLKPGGVLAISTFGADNFRELSDVIPNRKFPDAGQWRRELEQTGFKVETVKETAVMMFSSPRQLLMHLRLTGVNAVHSPASALRGASAILRSGLRTLTYKPLYIIATRPNTPKEQNSVDLRTL